MPQTTRPARSLVILNIGGFRRLRNSPGVVRMLSGITSSIAKAAGPGFNHEVERGRTRARGAVYTATGEAMRRAAQDQTLMRAIDAGRRFRL